MARRVDIALVADDGQPAPGLALRIAAYRLRSDKPRAPSDAALLLWEQHTYEFSILGAPAGATLDSSHQELFVFAEDRPGGRLRTGDHVGSLRVRFTANGAPLGYAELEIRPRKLSYHRDYRRMLEDLCAPDALPLLRRFAPTTVQLQVDADLDSGTQTRYHRFVLLRALLEAYVYEALDYVGREPYVSWEGASERRAIGRGVPPGRHIARQLASAHGRRASPSHLRGLVPSLPTHLDVRRTQTTLDNTPNRFVRHALDSWLELTGDVQRRLADAAQRSKGPVPQPVLRGLRECEEVARALQVRCHLAPFQRARRPDRIDWSNQVLQKRAGYRGVLQGWLSFEHASRLADRSPDDARFVFHAAQKKASDLYEMWCFFQVAAIVSSLPGASPFDPTSELVDTADGLDKSVQQGHRRVTGVVVDGVSVELFYNRTFSTTAEPSEESTWSRPMRPDLSLRFRRAEPTPRGSAAALLNPAIWIHLDAKYRVDGIRDLFGDRGADPDDAARIATEARAGRVKRDDLLRMHAYRDAIRQSAGSYVLYPGGGTRSEKLAPYPYEEVLPGLGAFSLMPGRQQGASAPGAEALRQFIEETIQHIAADNTRRARADWWRRSIYRKEHADERRPSAPSQAAWRRHPSETRALIVSTTPDILAFAKSEREVPFSAGDGPANASLSPRALRADVVVVVTGDDAQATPLWGVPAPSKPLRVTTPSDRDPRLSGLTAYTMRLPIQGLERVPDWLASAVRGVAPPTEEGVAWRLVSWSEVLGRSQGR